MLILVASCSQCSPVNALVLSIFSTKWDGNVIAEWPGGAAIILRTVLTLWPCGCIPAHYCSSGLDFRHLSFEKMQDNSGWWHESNFFLLNTNSIPFLKFDCTPAKQKKITRRNHINYSLVVEEIQNNSVFYGTNQAQMLRAEFNSGNRFCSMFAGMWFKYIIFIFKNRLNFTAGTSHVCNKSIRSSLYLLHPFATGVHLSPLLPQFLSQPFNKAVWLTWKIIPTSHWSQGFGVLDNLLEHLSHHLATDSFHFFTRSSDLCVPLIPSYMRSRKVSSLFSFYLIQRAAVNLSITGFHV